jgi:DNA polymerase-3 subunit epsilon/ATP-dependent DNA helicase DinG
MFKFPFVVLDVETNGTNPKADKIIEVGLIRYENGKEVARYEALLECDEPLPEIITAITGLTDAILAKEGQPRAEVYAKVSDLLKDAYLVGHNIQFDLSFLKATKMKLELAGSIDTIPLSQIVWPQSASYSLESLADDLEIEYETRHRALSDTQVTLVLFEKIFEQISALSATALKDIQSAVKKSSWDGAICFEGIGGRKGSKAVQTLSVQSSKAPSDSAGIKRALTVHEVFGPEGVLKQNWADFEIRDQQVTMSEAVEKAFLDEYHLICEAPTGIGKSMAYLVPAVAQAIANKSKVVVSTHTVTLQQQLFEKDVPLLSELYQKATGNPGFRAALLKGRSHYLCLRRLHDFKRRSRLSAEEAVLLTKILVWLEQTQTGDSAEIHLARHEYPIWDFELCSDKKYCSEDKCKPYGECYLHKARRLAEESDLLIVNHALLCADLQSEGNLLPEYNYLVVDEAHHFDEVATKSYGVQITQDNFVLPLKVIRTKLDEIQERSGLLMGGTAKGVLDEILERLSDVNQSIDNLFSLVGLFVGRHVEDTGFVENLLIDTTLSTTEEWLNLGDSVSTVSAQLGGWLGKLGEFTDLMLMAMGDAKTGGLDELLQERQVLSEQMRLLAQYFATEMPTENDPAGGFIRWMSADVTGKVTIQMVPMLVGPSLKTALYDKKKSVVLTSATLAIQIKDTSFDAPEQKPFAYFRKMLDLDDKFEELILSSPYDFEKQAYVILPSDLPPVVAASHISAISDLFLHLIKTVKGGLMALFTSYQAIQNVYLKIFQPLQGENVTLLAQGLSGGRGKILKAYMNNPDHSALLGTSSFWEGIDIKGDALTTLVIHKLPFDMPSDPIVKARRQLFSNGFNEYQLPRAILRFRQGFGRLIRSGTDFGVMIVLDSRLTSQAYGKMFLEALPRVPIERMKSAEVPAKVKEWLDLQRS